MPKELLSEQKLTTGYIAGTQTALTPHLVCPPHLSEGTWIQLPYTVLGSWFGDLQASAGILHEKESKAGDTIAKNTFMF